MNSNPFLVDKNALDYGYHAAQHAVSKIFFTIPSQIAVIGPVIFEIGHCRRKGIKI